MGGDEGTEYEMKGCGSLLTATEGRDFTNKLVLERLRDKAVTVGMCSPRRRVISGGL